MYRILIELVLVVLLGLFSNIVSGFLQPAANRNKRLTTSIFIFLVCLSFLFAISVEWEENFSRSSTAVTSLDRRNEIESTSGNESTSSNSLEEGHSPETRRFDRLPVSSRSIQSPSVESPDSLQDSHVSAKASQETQSELTSAEATQETAPTSNRIIASDIEETIDITGMWRVRSGNQTTSFLIDKTQLEDNEHPTFVIAEFIQKSQDALASENYTFVGATFDDSPIVNNEFTFATVGAGKQKFILTLTASQSDKKLTMRGTAMEVVDEEGELPEEEARINVEMFKVY